MQHDAAGDCEDVLSIAQDRFLSAHGLLGSQLSNITARICSRGVDFADLYFQYACSESWSLEEGLIKSGCFSIEQGVGVRAICGDKVALAYSDDISNASLSLAADTVRAIGRQGQSVRVALPRYVAGHSLYQPTNPHTGFSEAAKLAVLKKAEAAVYRCAQATVKQVMVFLAGSYEVVLVVRSDGHMAADVRPLVRFSIRVIVEKEGRCEQGVSGGGGRCGYDCFTDERIEYYAAKAVHEAQTNLLAGPAPAGVMTVVLGAGWPGILLHEAIGHGLEGDFNRKGLSAFAGKMGEMVASSGVTVVDDGTLPQRRGSLNVDDEGNRTQCTTLIEKGVLSGYLQDMMNAKLMNTTSTGNGRRESYAHITMPRMTNTYMLPGPYDPQEIIASVDHGLYMVNFGGGQVDITNGHFVFSASEAYCIEKGQITSPVKGATLIGYGPEVLTRVNMVGNDLSLDDGVGTCGKEGQNVPVGVGQPTLKLDAITVGGTVPTS